MNSKSSSRFSVSSIATFRGTLDFGALATTGSAVPNFALTSTQNFIPTPSNLGDRVAVAAGIFAEWRLAEFHVRFVSSSSSATNGLLAIGVIDDAASTAGFSAPTIAQVCAMKGSVENGIWKNIDLSWKNPSAKYLYTSSEAKDTVDLRWASPLTVYLAGFGLANSTTYGRIEIDYVCHMRGNTPNLTLTSNSQKQHISAVAASSEKTLDVVNFIPAMATSAPMQTNCQSCIGITTGTRPDNTELSNYFARDARLSATAGVGTSLRSRP